MSIPYSVARVHGHWTVDSIENGKVNPPPSLSPFLPVLMYCLCLYPIFWPE